MMINIILILDACINVYCIDQFKYIGLVLNFSDYLVSSVLLSTGLMYIISGFVLSYLWVNYHFLVVLAVLVLS